MDREEKLEHLQYKGKDGKYYQSYPSLVEANKDWFDRMYPKDLSNFISQDSL